MPIMVTILFVLAGLILPRFGSLVPPAHAQDLDAAEAALSQGDYARSRQLATEAIRAGTRAGGELAVPYRVLALACGYLDDADAATRAFITLLALDPSYRIQEGLPVEVRSPYMDARGFWSSHLQRLSVDLALGVDRTTLTISLHDPASVSARVRVRARLAGSGPFMEFVRPSAAATSLDMEGLATTDHVDYAITLLDEHGNRVWQLGTEAQPLRLTRPADAQAVATRAPRSFAPEVIYQRAPDLSGSTRRRSYLAVGSALLGLGVGASSVGAYYHAKREQLAGRWNRGDCDGPGTTRGTICATEDKQIERRTQLAVGLYSAGAVSIISGLTLLLLAPARHEERGRVHRQALAWSCSQVGFELGVLCARGF